MRNLSTTVFLIANLVSLPAFATGERILIASTGAASDQLKQTLCIAMECVGAKDGIEAMVTAKSSREGIEVKVVGMDGAVRLNHKAPVLDDGRFSATDLVSATTRIFKAIESPQLAAEQAKQDKAEAQRVKEDKAEKLAKAAKAKAAKSKALAAKLRKKGALRLAAR